MLRQQQQQEEAYGFINEHQPLFRSKEKEKIGGSGNGEFNKKKTITPVLLPDTVTAENLAPMIGQSIVELIKWQIKAGLKPTSRYEPIVDDILLLMGQDYYFSPMRVLSRDILLQRKEKELKLKANPLWPSRPPVVTVVGHIDHGKTSLLDFLRSTSVVDNEPGRITQHIGAFEVLINDRSDAKKAKRAITFMDTPGHSAFSTMRERGVGITDIVLLVVAADDGVQEQTIEAIKAIKKNDVQVIVVINKMDKPDANPELVKMELLENGIACEGVGGDVPCVEISAKTGMGIQTLEETILFIGDMMELKAPVKDVQVSGVVIETSFKRNRGTYSTILVQKGILKINQFFVCGESHGKIKEMKNHLGTQLKEGKPGQAVEIFGFKEGAPPLGEEFFVFDSEKEVLAIIDERKERKISEDTRREIKKMAYGKEDEEEDLDNEEEMNGTEDLGDIEKKTVRFFVKGDVTGTAEALSAMLFTLPQDPEISIDIQRVGYGEVTENDIKDALFLKTPIVYFGSKLNPKILDSCKKQGVKLIQSDVIYHVVNHVQEYLESILQPVTIFNVTGRAQISQVFDINDGKEKVAGCKVEDGIIKKGAKVHVMRNGDSVHEGRVEVIKSFKDIVKEIGKGHECGITLREYNGIQVGDLLVSYTQDSESRKLGEFVKYRFNTTF